ncbi:unnamed protein product [Amaranthus hypochondriacus]
MGCCSSKQGRKDNEYDVKNNRINNGDEQILNKVYPSDYDRGYWVGEPGIDYKASDFITKVHRTLKLPTSNNGASIN